MRYKLIKIEGCETCNEVLVQIQRNDEGEDTVQVSAWHSHEGENFIQSTTVSFSGESEVIMMERFVADFSQTSALDFANSMEF